MSSETPENREKLFAIGIDPWVTTGLALVSRAKSNAHGYRLGIEAISEVDSRDYGEWDSVKIACGWIVSVCLEPELLAGIVVEDFVLRRSEMDRTLLAPVRIMSLLAPLLAYSSGTSSFSYEPRPGQPFQLTTIALTTAPDHNIPCVVQQPSQAKSTFTDERMKHYELYKPTKGARHARDAARHAATYLHGLP